MGIDFMKRQIRNGLRGVSDEEIVVLLEPGIEIEGEMKAGSGMVRVNCQFKGAIRSTGTIIVASQGDIEADIDALQVSIAGKVKGNIRALNQLEIKENGILMGAVETPLLRVESGAYFTGHCDMPTHRVEQSSQSEDVPDEREQNSRLPGN